MVSRSREWEAVVRSVSEDSATELGLRLCLIVGTQLVRTTIVLLAVSESSWLSRFVGEFLETADLPVFRPGISVKLGKQE